MSRRVTILFFGLVTVSLVASACGGSSPSSSNGAAGAPQSQRTHGVTKDSIVVGGVVTKTSAAGFSEAGVDAGAAARFAEQNAAGGVYGRKIDYIGSQDDGLNPSMDLQIAQKLIQNNHVFAVVPVGAPAFVGAGNYLVQQHVPFIGWGTTPPFCNNQYGFGIFGCNAVTGSGYKASTAEEVFLADQLHGAKGKTAGVIAAQNQAGQASVSSTAAALKAVGFRVVYSQASLPAGAITDYTPYATSLMKANGGSGPDVIVLNIETSQVVGLRSALHALGYKGLTADGVTYDPTVLSNPANRQALQGEYVSVPFQPFEDRTPAVDSMVSALRKHIGGSKFVPTQYMAYGYWMADMFIQMAKQAGPSLTLDGFLKAANSFTFQEQGGTGTTSFPEEKNASSPCSAMAQIEGSQFVVRSPLKCTPLAPLS